MAHAIIAENKELLKDVLTYKIQGCISDSIELQKNVVSILQRNRMGQDLD